MKLKAEIGDETREIEINERDGRLEATVDGRQYEIESSQPEPGVYLFKHEGRIYEASVSKPSASGEPHKVRLRGRETEVRIIDPKRLRGAGSAQDHGDGLAEIKTAMPGKLVRVIAEAGAEVKKGDGIVVVEAMKMQNELKSPKDGTVREIKAKEGQTVAAGEVLATVE
jgi:biotin carboxyl carrier protein